MSESKLVFSTAGKVKKKDKSPRTEVIAKGPCKIRLETKGRGGKQVTVLHNLPFSQIEAKALMRTLQEALGCGASYKNGEILISGDHRKAIEVIFMEKKMKIIRSGG